MFNIHWPARPPAPAAGHWTQALQDLPAARRGLGAGAWRPGLPLLPAGARPLCCRECRDACGCLAARCPCGGLGRLPAARALPALRPWRQPVQQPPAHPHTQCGRFHELSSFDGERRSCRWGALVPGCFLFPHIPSHSKIPPYWRGHHVGCLLARGAAGGNPRPGEVLRARGVALAAPARDFVGYASGRGTPGGERSLACGAERQMWAPFLEHLMPAGHGKGGTEWAFRLAHIPNNPSQLSDTPLQVRTTKAQRAAAEESRGAGGCEQ